MPYQTEIESWWEIQGGEPVEMHGDHIVYHTDDEDQIVCRTGNVEGSMETAQNIADAMNVKKHELKQVEWRGDGGNSYWSETDPPLCYYVTGLPYGWSCKIGTLRIKPDNDGETDYFDSREEAWAAAENDLKSRIEALTTSKGG